MSLLRQDYEQAKKRLDNNYKYFNPQEYLRSQLKSPFMRLFAKLRSIEINSLDERNLHDRESVVRYEINEKAHKQYVGAINKNRDRRRRVGRRIR